MVEGVVEVEGVTCCAGDAACPIAVASALEMAPILTVTDDDDWDNRGELLVAILMKQIHFVLCKQCHTARNGACSRSLLILQYYFVYNVYRTRPPAVCARREQKGRFINRKRDLLIEREIYKSEGRLIL